MTKKKYFAANWKLNKTPAETKDFFNKLKPQINKLNASDSEYIFFPPALCSETTSTSLSGSQINWGPQNIFSKDKGAFTGENSVTTAKEMGATYCLIGHSERRQYFFETDIQIAEKINLVQSLDMIPMLCFGENLEQRESGKTNQINQEQIEKALCKIIPGKKIMFAYEPVWAIGTGKVATPEQVAQAHHFIFSILKRLNLETSPILYGGSVKPDNAKSLLKIPYVDGFLIGGASLEVDSYLGICS